MGVCLKVLTGMGMFSAPSGCCCEPFYDAICIYNSNAICDHDFDVFLNSTFIGNRLGCQTGNPPGVGDANCVASIWSLDQIVNSLWTGFPFFCGPITIETFDLDTSLFINGTNELKLVTTNTNSIDNFGQLRIVRVQGTTLLTTFLSDTYTSSGFGAVTLTYNFTWTP